MTRVVQGGRLGALGAACALGSPPPFITATPTSAALTASLKLAIVRVLPETTKIATVPAILDEGNLDVPERPKSQPAKNLSIKSKAYAAQRDPVPVVGIRANSYCASFMLNCT